MAHPTTGPCIGVLGGGQLALMLAQAASDLAIRVRTLDTTPDAPAALLTDHHVGRFDDPDAIARFAAGCNVVTCEFENVPAATLESAARHAPVHPSPRAFATAQDRALERGLFTSLGIPTPRWLAIDTLADVDAALSKIGLPLLLKTRRMGYDGKGQRLVRTPDEARAAATELLASAPGGLIADEVVDLRAEVSVIAVRSTTGQTASYPLCQNEHRKGILWKTLAPAPIVTSHPQLEAQARAAAMRVAQALDYVGVLAVEFFIAATPGAAPALLANEMAPRVHNTGHWTIEGAETSQFMNHVRAVLGLPLGSTEMRAGAHAAMLNIVGRAPDPAALLAVPGLSVHMYGKSSRSGRKLGHATICDVNPDRHSERLASLERLITWDA